MQTDVDLEKALAVARRAVAAAGEAALRHFRTGVAVSLKLDRSPVTAADHAAEAAILGIIQEAFPDHDLLTEESGARGGGSPWRWIVDPLDGTRGFIRGGSFWGPLVALQHRGEVLVGATAMPVRQESYFAARGLGTFRGDGERLRVSQIGKWSEATLSCGELGHLLAPPHGAAVTQLVRGAASARCHGDTASGIMVLLGQAEAWLEAGVRTWDIAPYKILIEEAGGRFTDFEGTPSIETGRAVISNGLVHDHVLGILRSAAA